MAAYVDDRLAHLFHGERTKSWMARQGFGWWQSVVRPCRISHLKDLQLQPHDDKRYAIASCKSPQ